jgi:HemY protein
LEEDEHGDEEKVRAWLVRAIRANPDPVWCCATCGNVAAAWGAVCSRCDSFDSFEWRAPAHVVALAAPEDIDEDANVVETHSIRSS